MLEETLKKSIGIIGKIKSIEPTMKDILTIHYPFGAWMFGVKYATSISRGNELWNEIWFEFRWPWEHTSYFHRITIKICPTQKHK